MPSPKRLLLVMADECSADWIESDLAAPDLAVAVAADLVRALALLRHVTPDVVVLAAGGDEDAAAAFVDVVCASGAAVLVISSSTPLQLRCLALGAHACIATPVPARAVTEFVTREFAGMG